MANGMGSFATGLLTGYTQGQRAQQQQELHELQVAKLRDERAMAEEFKLLNQDTKPSSGFVVETPTGESTVFTDEKTAKEAAANIEGAQMRPTFLVGGQQFASEGEAKLAAEHANDPAVKMRKQAGIAQKYGRPDLAESFNKNYTSMMEAKRTQLLEDVGRAAITGDFSTVLDTYSQATGGRVKVQMVPNGQGGMALVSTGADGQQRVVGEYGSPQEAADQIGMMVNNSPTASFERMKYRTGLQQDARDYALKEKATLAGMANDSARTGIAASGLGLQQQKFNYEKQKYDEALARGDTPKVISGVDEGGNTMLSTTRPVWNPTTQSYDLQTTPPQTVPGMKPVSSQRAGGLDALLFGGAAPGAPAPLVIDWGKVPRKNMGGATAPVGPPPGAVQDANGNWTDGQRAGGLITR